jgi:phenylacetate-CoA ligase
MKIGEYIRNRTFKILDGLRKESIHQYVHELRSFEAGGYNYTIVEEKLNGFLSRVQNSSPFYENKKNEFNLNMYPVIAKRDLRNNIAQIKSLSYANKKLVKVSTSGSYGTPFTFYLTPGKKKRQLAEVLYHGESIGYEVGIKHAFFRTVLHKSKLKLWLQNEIHIPSKVLGQDFLEQSRFLIKKKKIRLLMGFPSAIVLLAQFCIDQGDQQTDFAIKGVITYAENITKKQRDSISQAFGCKVYSRYGTEELGILGGQIDNESDFILNTCNYVVEVLKLDEDVTVQPGETGRVVVTDLYSDAIPLIRYETGDLAVLGEVFNENKGWAKSLRSLSGRVIQMLNATNGEKLYPLYFENVIEKIKNFGQYQLIQETAKDFTLNLVPNSAFNKIVFSETLLIKEMRDWLGQDAHIKIQLVNDIEMLPSGKRPSVINTFVNV